MTLEALVAIAVVGLLFGVAAWSRAFEVEDWNGGTCRASGRAWRLLKSNRQRGRLYSDGAGRWTWITWPGVDAHNRRET